MSVKPYLLAVGFALLCVGWAQAESLSPNFTITLTDWGDDESFTAGATSTDTYTGPGSGFTQNVLCPSGDWQKCICDDPRAILDGGGDALDFNLDAPPPPFSVNANGDLTLDFLNVGPDIKSFFLLTTITSTQENELFTCSSDDFYFCGFKIVDPSGSEQLEVLFTDPRGDGIPTAVPEPNQYAMMLIGFAASILLARSLRTKLR
jgi:hypothetical protein